VGELDAKKANGYTVSPREVLQFVHEMITALASKLEQISVTCVNLFLQCALVADRCQFEAIAYEFITQAFIVYEDQITNSREQVKALELMVSSLHATAQLTSANYDTLATKTTQYAAKLLKKADQASMVLHCAQLFWVRSARTARPLRWCLDVACVVSIRVTRTASA
jgi:vacuolar protein sorting-associated protein 35